MPTVIISKTKLRRGTNAQRKLVVFDQGEAVYTTDTKRLFIGTGTTLGGLPIGSVVHPPITNYYNLSEIVAEIGDLVYVNNLYYQLTASDYSTITSWGNVGLKLNTSTFRYDSSNNLCLAVNAISASDLNTNTITAPLSVIGGALVLRYNTASFELSSNHLTLKSGSVSQNSIPTSALSSGLLGGWDGAASTPLRIDANANYFKFSGNTLSLNPNASWIGSGLLITAGTAPLSSVSVNVDNSTVVVNSSNQVAMKVVALSGSPEWSKQTIDNYGRTITHQSSIYGALTGNSTTNSGNTLSSIFNGSPSQSLSGGIPGIQLTTFTVVDSTGTTRTLSSAGFIMFEGNTTARNGDTIGRFAIPIFSY